MATSDFESQLRQLVAQSKPYVGKEIAELESNVIQGWLQEEQKKVNKLYQQIDRICRLHGLPVIMSLSLINIESELRQLMSKSQPYMAKEIIAQHSTTMRGWIQDEQQIVNKLYQQMERIIRLHGTMLPAKLFNDSRECLEQLEDYIFRLKDAMFHLSRIAGLKIKTQADLIMTESLSDLYIDGNRREKKLVCYRFNKT
ncbi:TRAFAC class myosin-kinesin ATPase super [Dermatophagoides farinae]|uniref:TRAFAC class myosin-kinesin ATPase super n=1 Tax=Dermatophagoides farinae TaxID=6954 RepID=A0A922L9W6_DERFA|nr:TRAFAC class myosin-kinesin ATPase super [Dermatophagoides farinae]